MALAQGRAPGSDDPFSELEKSRFPVLRCDAEGYVLTRPAPMQVTDEMVYRAVESFFRGPRPEYREDMRRALEAALRSND